MSGKTGTGKFFCGHQSHRRRNPDKPPAVKPDIERLCIEAERTGDWKPVIDRQAELIGGSR